MRGSGACAALALCLACQGDDWIIAGELPEDDGSSSDPGTPEFVNDPSGCPSAAERLAEREAAVAASSVAAQFVGRWEGEPQLVGGFPSSELALTIGADATGVLSFSPGPIMGEPEADDAYLCGMFGTDRVVCGSDSGFVSGYSYRLQGIVTRGNVLSFSIVMADPWSDWCALQQPIRREDSSEACGFSFDVLPAAEPRFSEQGCVLVGMDGPEEIDCPLLYALDHCDCGSDACFASFARRVEVGVALTSDEASLRGSLWYEDGSNAAPIVLQRTP
ncbi:MAG TPA: hypothetical protein VMG12_05435 [Polyangiaceae bacterium]|nr:hypothetical protein [Polyangiaceae bacterium]